MTEILDKEFILPKIRDHFEIDKYLASDDELWEAARDTSIVRVMIIKRALNMFAKSMKDIING